MVEICLMLLLNCFQQKDIWKNDEQIEGSQKITAANISNPWSAAENERDIEIACGKPLQPEWLDVREARIFKYAEWVKI